MLYSCLKEVTNAREKFSIHLEMDFIFDEVTAGRLLRRLEMVEAPPITDFNSDAVSGLDFAESFLSAIVDIGPSSNTFTFSNWISFTILKNFSPRIK
ncbi:hypothetical protein ACFLZV_01080 [Candidatus Margulisiibacteriota bacterium]